MKINLDRLCKLAGLESNTQTLNEASNSSMRDDPALAGEAEYRYGSGQLAEGDGDADDERGQDAEVSEMMHGHSMEEDDHSEGMGHMRMEEDMDEDMDEAMYEKEDHDEGMGHGHMGMEEDMDEMIEVDEAMLVQEIRRARQMIAEAAQRKASPANLSEQKLKEIVAEEVENVMKDLNLTAGWVYGSNKPTNSRRGVVNTAFPGIGFKNSK